MVKFGRLGICKENVKLFMFLKSIAAYNLKVSRYIKLNDLMKIHEYQRSMSLFDLCKRSLHVQS